LAENRSFSGSGRPRGALKPNKKVGGEAPHLFQTGTDADPEIQSRICFPAGRHSLEGPVVPYGPRCLALLCLALPCLAFPFSALLVLALRGTWATLRYKGNCYVRPKWGETGGTARAALHCQALLSIESKMRPRQSLRGCTLGGDSKFVKGRKSVILGVWAAPGVSVAISLGRGASPLPF